MGGIVVGSLSASFDSQTAPMRTPSVRDLHFVDDSVYESPLKNGRDSSGRSGWTWKDPGGRTRAAFLFIASVLACAAWTSWVLSDEVCLDRSLLDAVHNKQRSIASENLCPRAHTNPDDGSAARVTQSNDARCTSAIVPDEKARLPRRRLSSSSWISLTHSSVHSKSFPCALARPLYEGERTLCRFAGPANLMFCAGQTTRRPSESQVPPSALSILPTRPLYSLSLRPRHTPLWARPILGHPLGTVANPRPCRMENTEPH